MQSLVRMTIMDLLATEAYYGLRVRHISLIVALVAAMGWAPPQLGARPQEDPPPAAQADGSEKKVEGQADETSEPASEEAGPSEEKSKKTYPVSNGSTNYGRTEEFEKKKTADGEVEIKRVRAPYYGGDRQVLYENETRTRKLPDGTVEREHVLRNPDGSGRMVPIEIIREKVRTTPKGIVTEREMSRPDPAGGWRPLRKEVITQTGDKSDLKSVREVREKNLAGDWKVVDRTVTSEKASDTEKSTRSVRQTPNVYDELADYEVREENTSKDGDKETSEVNVRRRDPQDTHEPKFFLVERTKREETKSADGKVVRKTVTESDLSDHGASRNITPGASKVVEEKTEVETTAADGSARRTVTGQERGAVNRELRPAGRVVQQTDSQGNVRQILLPSR